MTRRSITAALRHGAGFGYAAEYKYYVVHTGTDRWMAIFLDSYQELHAVVTFAWMSLAAAAVCVALVYVIIVLCSRRAIAPVIQASERQKQFITDASHELKTPITVIATSLKVLEMEVGQQKWIDKAENQTEKLTELVNELVTLSRMDEESSPLQMADFPVSDALAETAESFRDFAASAGHTLDVRVTPGLTYCGDEYAIRQLVSILLDNAVKYAAPDTPIVFSLEKGGAASSSARKISATRSTRLRSAGSLTAFTAQTPPAAPRPAASASGCPSRAASPRGTAAPSAPRAPTGARSCSQPS